MFLLEYELIKNLYEIGFGGIFNIVEIRSIKIED